MCKPDKSFNTWVKVISHRMKNALQEQPCRRGSAPYRHSDWTSHLWGCPKKTDCLKRRASDAPSSLFFWRSDSLEHGLNISEAAPSNVRAGPLDSRLENQPFMGLRLCQSRIGATNSTIAEESFPGDVTRQRSKPAEFPEQRVELNTWHPKQRTHAGNETNFEPALNQSKQVQTEFYPD